MLEINKVHLGDCLELMKEIPDKSIDSVICDLPYGTTVCKWDSVIPFEPLWEQYKRVVKDNGAIVLFGGQPFTSTMITSNVRMFKYSWVWVKENGTGFINAHHQPLRIFEDICIFSKSDAVPAAINKMAYYPQGLVAYDKITKRGRGGEAYVQKTIKNENYQKYTNYPTNVLYFSRDSKKIHPTQKPIALLEYLIKTYTNEGELVLDNCIGSGSTAIAAINTGRNFIGIEKDENYFNITNNRISMHLNNQMKGE